MKKVYNLLKKGTVLMGLALMTSMSANALTYTAVADGNFNAAATWGGTAPSGNLTTDIIIIPSGITVTLNTDETFSLTSSLTVDGTLSSGANNTALIMTGGTLTGSGTIDVDSLALGVLAGFTYTGDITANNMTSLTSTISAAADVTVDNNLYLTLGALNLTDGSLTLSNNANIVVDGGSLTTGGTGALVMNNNYNVVYMGSSTTSGLELSGSGLSNVTLNLSSGTVTLSNDLALNGTLDLNSGNLVLNGNDLTFGPNGNISASGTGTINSSSTSNITINSNNGFAGTLMLGTGNNSIHNLTINFGNTSGNVSLGSDLQIDGTLSLNSGTLSLNGKNLAFTGGADVAVGGSGSIVGSTASNISVLSNNDFTGWLRFNATGNTVNNLTIKMGSNTANANLGTDLNVAGTLDLNTGTLNVGTNDLHLNTGAMVTGGSANSYVITSDGGTLTMNLAAGGSDMFQVGTENHYAPANVAANTGSASGDVSVMVMDSVYANGMTGNNMSTATSLVNATWDVTSSASAAIDYNLQVMWSTSMEVNGFDRTQAYVSHYTNGNWDLNATAAATAAAGGMFTLNRNNITSLSPFTVADAQSTLEVGTIANNTLGMTVYPNPSADIVYYTAPAVISQVDVLDISGRVIKTIYPDYNRSFSVSDLNPGYYNLHFTGKDFSSTQHFVKQ